MTPTVLFRNRYYLQLSPHCPEINKKSMWEVKSCHLAAARRVKLWSLNANLFFEEPEQLTKFAFKICPFKPRLAEVSLQCSNCNILRLAATLVFFANKARFRCSSGHALSKTKSLTPPPPPIFLHF